MTYPFLKGHGTENDFVLLPDHDGSVHGDLDPARVRALCDRRAGIGGDGVLRVVRDHVVLGEAGTGLWFMDYRNADGSTSEMCGNGIRVFGRHLVDEGLHDRAEPLPVATRDGVKTLVFADSGGITVDMGVPRLLGDTAVGARVGAAEETWPAVHVDMGNPHAVAFLPEGGPGLDDLGAVLAPPSYDEAVYPHGVNVELVVRRGERHVAMRVHERGSGETRSCGTGACAVAVAAAAADGAPRDVDYRVDLPGGTLTIRWTADDRVLMTGPAVVVARGETSL
ncbi:MAG: diaminopimelate epimerase [Nocardioides sp.]|nr:diaminopimelate epimerase [Nocardioides sp.]